MPRTAPQNPDLTTALLERDLLRAQLQALAVILPAEPKPPSTEITLLRDQLLALSGLLQASDGPAPSEKTEELRLLRDHLSYLQSDLGLGAAVPPPIPTNIEAAIARLLTDLVQETDRRIAAEGEVLATRATLRSLGHDGPPVRLPVAARPKN